MAQDIHQAVRDACLWLPEAEEVLSHGSPNFKVRGKSFATFVVNHHGDGRVALWLSAAPEVQSAYVESDPKYFFVPPYVGTRGWYGVHLDKGLPWKRIVSLVREAYERVAPGALAASIGAAPRVEAPTRLMKPAEIDPLCSARARSVLKDLRKFCLKLPETAEARQFGHPVWQAGKKSVALLTQSAGRLALMVWVGVERQGLLTDDPRYRIPPYMGHNGWISLDVADQSDATEVEALLLQSYRHFALKRMLRELPEVD